MFTYVCIWKYCIFKTFRHVHKFGSERYTNYSKPILLSQSSYFQMDRRSSSIFNVFCREACLMHSLLWCTALLCRSKIRHSAQHSFFVCVSWCLTCVPGSGSVSINCLSIHDGTSLYFFILFRDLHHTIEYYILYEQGDHGKSHI